VDLTDHERKEEPMDWKLENVVLPVSDVDRARAFYGDRLGFHLDVDHAPSEAFRVVQFTPPGSACSITFGVGVSTVAPGTYQGLHLVVNDIEAAHVFLRERGVECSQPFHFGPDGQAPGVDPERRNYGSYVSFRDPDGNGWLVQEVGHRS
jgi:catechol 2,3-dioxygenase-like lactoylglutathione lyase family enzyme